MTGLARAYLGMSLDGRIAGPEDELDWLTMDRERLAAASVPGSDAEWLGYEEFTADVGAMLMGRGTFDVVSSFESWPYEVPVTVATHRPMPAQLPRDVEASGGPIGELVAKALDRAGGRDLYVDGGALVSSALSAGLLDELTTTILPTVRGAGVGLFDRLEGPVDLDLTRMATNAGGAVQLTWEPHRPNHPRR